MSSAYGADWRALHGNEARTQRDTAAAERREDKQVVIQSVSRITSSTEQRGGVLAMTTTFIAGSRTYAESLGSSD